MSVLQRSGEFRRLRCSVFCGGDSGVSSGWRWDVRTAVVHPELESQVCLCLLTCISVDWCWPPLYPTACAVMSNSLIIACLFSFSASTCQVNVCFPSSVMLLHLSPGLTSVSLHEQCFLLVLSCVSLVFRSLSLLLTLHRLGLHVFSHVLPFFFLNLDVWKWQTPV